MQSLARAEKRVFGNAVTHSLASICSRLARLPNRSKLPEKWEENVGANSRKPSLDLTRYQEQVYILRGVHKRHSPQARCGACDLRGPSAEPSKRPLLERARTPIAS
jgi:hypothetical protein